VKRMMGALLREDAASGCRAIRWQVASVTALPAKPSPLLVEDSRRRSREGCTCSGIVREAFNERYERVRPRSIPPLVNRKSTTER